MLGDNKQFDLFIRSGREESLVVPLRLMNGTRHIIRFTGGCANMTAMDASTLYNLVPAFDGFRGAMLFGGTRMLMKYDDTTVLPGITEIPPMIKLRNPDSFALGIISRPDQLRIKGSMLVLSESEGFYTIPHPDQDTCMIVQDSVDEAGPWDKEYLGSAKYVGLLKTENNFRPLLFVYNGGRTTEKEILHWDHFGWDIMLVHGSGEKADYYANNPEFTSKPHVHVVENNLQSIQEKLLELKMISLITPEYVEASN